MATLDPTQTATSSGGYPIQNPGGPQMTQPPAPAPPQQPQQSTTGPSGTGFFSKIGQYLKAALPYIPDALNHLAAAGGNYAPLEAAHQQKELELQQAHQATADQLAQSQMQIQALQRERLGKENADFQTHAQAAEQAVAVSHAEKPTTYLTPEGRTGIADTDLKGSTAPRMVTLPNPEAVKQQPPPATLPPTIQTPAVMPQSVGFHVQDPVTGLVYEYGKNGPLMGTQPGPPNPNAPQVPGMGKVNPIDAGAAGTLPPSSRDYPKGAQDPGFRQEYQAWLSKAAGAKQANAVEVGRQRMIALNETKPQNVLSEGQDVISNIATEHAAHPNQPILSGNQSGATRLAGVQATFAEMNKNIGNVDKAIDDAFAANGGSLGSYAHRLAFATAVNPHSAQGGILNEIPGVSTANAMVQGGAQNQLAPGEKSLDFAMRNMRQGAAAMKTILSMGNVTDARIETLESELITPGDIMAGNQAAMHEKFNRFISIYRSVAESYPQLFGGTRGALQSGGVGGKSQPPAAPPAGPLPPPAAPKWNPQSLKFE